MIRSIPSISSSGNAIPQSTTMMLSLYSKAVMFIPICSRPPRGMIRMCSDFFCLVFLEPLEGVFWVLRRFAVCSPACSGSFSAGSGSFTVRAFRGSFMVRAFKGAFMVSAF